MRTWNSIRICLLAGTALAAGAPANAESLPEALEKAFKTNPVLEAQRATTRATDEGPVQARAAFGPTVSGAAGVEYRRDRTSLGPNSITDSGTTTSYSVNLNQPLFTSGRLTANLKRAEAQQEIGRESLRRAEQALIADVVAAYVAVQRDIAIYGVSLQNLSLLEEQYTITDSRFRLRDVTATDLNQTDTRRKIARARVQESISSLQSSAAAYRRLIGNFPQNLAPLPAPPPLPELDRLYDVAERDSPILRAAILNEVVTREALAAARAQRGPTVTGIAAISRNPLTPYTNFGEVNSVIAGVNVTMPFYTGGQISSQVREFDQLNQASQFQVEQARRQVREVVGASWEQANAANLASPVYEQAVLAAERALEGVRRQEQVGSRTARDVLETTNDLLSARTSAIASAATAFIATINSLEAAGSLTMEQFEAAPGTYDPDSYDPFFAKLAGLPLYPVVKLLDSVLHDASRNEQDILVERDPRFILEAVPTAPSAAGAQGVIPTAPAMRPNELPTAVPPRRP